MNAEADNKILRMTLFLELEAAARDAATKDALYFVMANNTFKVIPYNLAIAWEKKGDEIAIKSISGLGEIDNYEFEKWLRQRIRDTLKEKDAKTIHNLVVADGDEKYIPGQYLWAPCVISDDEILSGLIIVTAQAYDEKAIALLSRIIAVYSHAFRALSAKKIIPFFAPTMSQKKKWGIIAFTLLFFAVLPVRQSVLAQMEITSSDPWLATVPMNGAIEKIHVEPNKLVKKGDLLFTLDAQQIQHEYELKQKALSIAEAELHQARQRVIMRDPEIIARISLLEIELKRRQVDVDYLTQLLDKTQIRSDRDGIALFPSKDDLQGKPVQVGEKIMTVADLRKAEVTIYLPVGESISMPENARADVYLNINPARKIKSKIYNFSYEPNIRDNQSSYILKAALDSGEKIPMIGQRGMAKIFGYKTPLFMFLFRKPVGWLEQHMLVWGWMS